MLLVLGLAGGTQQALAETRDVRHLPVVEASGGRAISLTVEAPSSREPNIRVRYRASLSDEWVEQKFQRQEEHVYVATIPPEAANAPGVEYFIVGSLEEEGEEEAIFASEEYPHRILIRVDDKIVRQEQILESHKGRRSRVNLATEWVNFGTRSIAGRLIDDSPVEYVVPDNYLRIDLDFTYRIVRLPIRTLRFGYTRLVGETQVADSAQCFGIAEDEDNCSEEAGYKVGGWFEVGLGLHRATALDLRGMVMATAQGFSVGGRSEVRIGDLQGMHLAAGLEFMADVGNSIFTRMGWDSAPGFPMALTIAGSELPARRRDRGLRVVYDVGHEVAKGLRLGLRLNYQSRDDLNGAIGGGLNSSFEF